MPPSELFQTLKTVFDSENWGYAEVDSREVIQLGFEAHHTRVNLHVQAFSEMSAVSVVSESPAGTKDPATRERLAELAMRVNETLTVGNFEMQWDLGRLLFRATNIFPTPQGDPNIIVGLVHATVAEMDRIAPLISLILKAENDGAQLAAIDIPALMNQDDLLPPVPSDENE